MSKHVKQSGFSTLEQYQNLANAIVLGAVNEYRATLEFNKNKPDRAKIVSRTGAEKFFRSDYHRVLTNIDGEYLIKKLRKEVWGSDH